MRTRARDGLLPARWAVALCPLQHARELQRRLLLLVASVVLLLGATTRAGAFHSDLLGREVDEAAAQIGRTTAATFLQGQVLLVAPEVLHVVQHLTEELARAADLRVPLRVHLINSSLVNLMTLPSGDIFVFTGFLDKVETRDELAFGLAHELAHLALHHGVHQMHHALEAQRRGTHLATLLTTLVVAAVGGAVSGGMLLAPVGVAQPLFIKGAVEPLSEIAARLAAKVPEALVGYILAASLGAYSQAQEHAADQLGVDIMRKAGYHPGAALRVLEKFADVWHTR